MKKLRVLDLFSGIGGFSLGLERTGGFETVAFCEIEPFCQRVLRKHWPGVPIFGDIRGMAGWDFGVIGTTIDVICGGYPCQPFSVAGKRQGIADDRSLWPEFNKLVRLHKPYWVIAENVVGHISMGLDQVLSDLESQNYSARTFVIPACAVGADHRRARVWIVANLNGEGLPQRFVQSRIQEETGRHDHRENFAVGAWWKARPNLVRGVHGIPGRVDRIRSLGNAVVPQIPEIIGRAILAAEVAK